jgi:SNF2 family DNA or RNA helicase
VPGTRRRPCCQHVLQAVVAVCMRQFELTAHRWSLVVCPLSVLDTWQREIARFGCGLRVCVYRGDADERARVAENMKACAEHVLLTTYEVLHTN